MAKLVDLPARPRPGPGRGPARAPGSSRSTPTRPRPTRPRASVELILTSGTASGKSLSFNLPVLDGIARDAKRRRASTSTRPRRWPRTRRASSPSCGRPSLREAIYDGDTPREERPVDPPPRQPRAHQPRHAQRRGPPPPQALGRLPRQPRLGRRRRGPHLPRRLRLPRRQRAAAPAAGRAALRRPSPRFVMASATIANPGELAERLTGLEFELLDDDGAPRAGPRDRDVEPAGDRRGAPRRGARRSPRPPTCSRELVQRGVRTICFMRAGAGSS